MLREIISNEWYTILIVLSIGILTLAKYSFNTRFNDFLALVANSKYLKIYSRDQKFLDWFNVLLFINLIISITIFTILSYDKIVAPLAFELSLFFKLFTGIGAILFIKILLERLIGSVFEIDELIDSYLFQKISYKNFLGILLLPINIILIYTVDITNSILFVVIGLILLISVIGFLTSLKTYQKTIINNIFYFILYLCALEIAPIVILYKLFIIS